MQVERGAGGSRHCPDLISSTGTEEEAASRILSHGTDAYACVRQRIRGKNR